MNFFQSVTEAIPLSVLVQLPIAGFLAYQVWRLNTIQARVDERLKAIEANINKLREHRHTENNHMQLIETRLSLSEYRNSKESK